MTEWSGVVGRNVQLSERDRRLLAWIGEQYTVRVDLLAVLMAQHSDDLEAKRRGRLRHQTVSRRMLAWKASGLVRSQTFLAGTSATVWLTAEGMSVAGLPWRTYEPTVVTAAHRHAVGLVRAEAEQRGLGWICERELRKAWAAGPSTSPTALSSQSTTRARSGAPPSRWS